MKIESKIYAGLAIIFLIYASNWWKNEFDVYPFEKPLANYVKEEMKDNYVQNENYFDSLTAICTTLFPFKNIKFHSNNSIEVTLFSDGFDSSSFLQVSKNNINNYNFENGRFKSKKNPDWHIGQFWEWKFIGNINNKYFKGFLEYKNIPLETIVSLGETMEKVNCYSVSINGTSSFHYKYDKLKFLNLDYFTEEVWFHNHQDTIKVNEKISIGKCYH